LTRIKQSDFYIQPWEDYLLPDPEMFVQMAADRRFLEGEDHPYDLVLKDSTKISSITLMLVTYEPASMLTLAC